MPGSPIQNNMFNKSTGYVQNDNPFPVSSCGRRRNDGSPLTITDASYEKSNRDMRSKYKSETGKTLGSRQTSGTNSRRVSFACRFAGMKGPMKKPNGEATRKAIALKKWGFGSVQAARKFCNKHKKS
tara:strand:+ start:271 stop:651 length:381 start_codon:yes stop_codon:yes gene_type:complete